ncbi:MAG: HAMP domain-containing protein, partial [Cetobacterium sp.]
MKIKNDSLLLKIVFYNDIAIILTSIMITMVLTAITFKDMEDKVINEARNKIVLLSKGYQGYLNKARDDAFQVSRSIGEDVGTYQQIADTIKEELNKKNFKNYYDSVVTIVSESGEVLGEAGNKSILQTLTSNNTGLLLKNITKKEYEDTGYYLVKLNNDIYARIAVPYYHNNQKNYLVVTAPIDFALLQSLKNFLELSHRDRIFLLIENEFDKGDLNLEKGEVFLNKKVYDDLKLREYKFYYKNKDINNKPYYMALYTLTNYNNEYIGSFGVAISKEPMIKTKAMAAIFITILVIIVTIVSSTITSKIFRKLLEPLSNIADIADRVSGGEYDVEIPIEGSGELRTLSSSFKKMLIEIVSTQKTLKNKNEKLQENLERIDAIDKLLIGIHIEEDTSSTVKDLISAFTSEIGLGYSRAMFFRYSREKDYLIGEYTSINSIIKDQKDDILKERESCNGFGFQVEDIQELITFMKIPFKDSNLLSRALMERKIIYHNDKGYKYDLGNDLLKSLGLNNFLIFPIYNKNRYSGVILVDYYTRDRVISLEEVELLNLLSMNISVRMQNKILEEDRIDNERVQTIEKIAERFLSVRGDTLKRILEILESGETSDKIRENLEVLKPDLEKIERENCTLKAYSKIRESTFQPLSLDSLVLDAIEKIKEQIEGQGITLSLFTNY